MKCDMVRHMEDGVSDGSWIPQRAMTQKEAVRNMAGVNIDPIDSGWSLEQSAQKLKSQAGEMDPTPSVYNMSISLFFICKGAPT